jgi:diaminopimelate epimerase
MRFEKWQALGNDYLIVERDELPFALTPVRILRLCERHFGADADGVLLLSPAENPEHVADLRIFNADGSEAELSGNGAREAILYLRRRGWTDRDEFAIGTAAGEIRPTITGPNTCTVDMGRASLTSKDYPGGAPDGRGTLTTAGWNGSTATRTWQFRHVSIGNPQCAIHIADMTEMQLFELDRIGPEIEGHELFPNRTNVSMYTEIEPHRIRARIFERGVGETLSSGTGATGAAVAYVLERTADQAPRTGSERVTVALDGGELEVEVGEELQVSLTGWARPVYEGRLSDEFVNELMKEIDETE